MNTNRLSKTVIERLPLYLGYLKSEGAATAEHISSTTIAKALRLGEVQVRKDLALVSGAGRPKTGYVKANLIERLEEYLHFKAENTAVLVGAGKLGRALLDYDGFAEYGLQISAGFDSDGRKTGTAERGIPIYPLSAFTDFCRENHPRIGILTVPETSAQGICDLMTENGILAVWDFSGARLTVPDGILVRQENMASSLAVLSEHLNQVNQ